MAADLIVNLVCAINVAGWLAAPVEVAGPGQCRHAIDRQAILMGPIEFPVGCSRLATALNYIGYAASIGATQARIARGTPSTPPIPEMTYGRALQDIARLENCLEAQQAPEQRK